MRKTIALLAFLSISSTAFAENAVIASETIQAALGLSKVKEAIAENSQIALLKSITHSGADGLSHVNLHFETAISPISKVCSVKVVMLKTAVVPEGFESVNGRFAAEITNTCK